MPKERTPLTKSRIEKAKVPPGTGQIMLWDAIVSGFGVRCLPGGSKTFVFRYRPYGGGRSVNPRLLKLGAFPSISLEDARAAARIHAGNVAKGKDPAAAAGGGAAAQSRHAGQAPGQGRTLRTAPEGARAGQHKAGAELAAARPEGSHGGRRRRSVPQ